MQKLIITLILFISGTLVSIAQEQTHHLTVEITGMKNNNGRVYVALYNSEKTFLKDGFRGAIAKVSDKKATVVFKNIPEGTYAISVYHDADNNQKMDANFLGIPKERYGFSNNARGFMGPAKFKNAKFILSNDMTTHIKIH